MELSEHHSPAGVFSYVAGLGWGGGKGRRLPICCNLSLVPFHWSLGGMAGPADRPASGAHLFPGPGRHRAPAPLPVGTAAERIGRPRALPGPGSGRDQAAQQSVALSQVVPRSLGEVSLAKGGPGAYPAGGAERVGPGHLGRKRAGETGKYRPGGIVPGPLQQGGTPEAHQARLLQSAGRTAGIRSRPAMAHRHGGRDAGASRPGGHALVDQPGQIGQPPAGAT